MAFKKLLICPLCTNYSFIYYTIHKGILIKFLCYLYIHAVYILHKVKKKPELRPTRRVTVDALKSPAVSLPQLAMAVEAAPFPDTTPALVPEASGPKATYIR